MSKLKSYHFDLGNSTNGAIGFCGRVQARDSKAAVSKLKYLLGLLNGEYDLAKGAGLKGQDEDLEYLSIYFNTDAISEKDIDEVNPADERAAS